MDREAWWVTVHAVVRVGHDLATKPPPPPFIAALFTTVRTWKQPKCPFADRQTDEEDVAPTHRGTTTRPQKRTACLLLQPGEQEHLVLLHRRGEPDTTRPLPESATPGGVSQT